jgi:CheY-like chemotaxis protein
MRTGTDLEEGYVWIEVADDGPGMPPDLERRAVEPFFTTKAQGTGLGLAMVYACAHRYGGRLDIDTRPGRGTVVRLSFPTADVVETKAAAANRPTLGRLLLVDDEPGTRLVLETLLADEGFTVETASTAADALAKAFAFAPDVLLADFQLPDFDGVTLSRRVRAEHRNLPVLIMSGFDETHGEVAELLREPRTEHILKPIELEQLMTRLARMLEAS